MTDNILLDFTGPTHRQPLTLWPGDTNYGPYQFDCSGACPDGVAITEAEATTYLDGTAVDIITANSQSVDGTDFYCRFSVPADATAGSYYMRIEAKLSNMTGDETKMLRFGPITVNEIPAPAA